MRFSERLSSPWGRSRIQEPTAEALRTHMYLNHLVAVVMPVYNEQGPVANAVSSVPGFIDVIVVVDDGSTDWTWRVLSGLADERLIRLRHSSNRGVGAAIKTGYQHCLTTNAELIAI